MPAAWRRRTASMRRPSSASRMRATRASAPALRPARPRRARHSRPAPPRSPAALRARAHALRCSAPPGRRRRGGAAAASRSERARTPVSSQATTRNVVTAPAEKRRECEHPGAEHHARPGTRPRTRAAPCNAMRSRHRARTRCTSSSSSLRVSGLMSSPVRPSVLRLSVCSRAPSRPPAETLPRPAGTTRVPAVVSVSWGVRLLASGRAVARIDRSRGQTQVVGLEPLEPGLLGGRIGRDHADAVARRSGPPAPRRSRSPPARRPATRSAARAGPARRLGLRTSNWAAAGGRCHGDGRYFPYGPGRGAFHPARRVLRQLVHQGQKDRLERQRRSRRCRARRPR